MTSAAAGNARPVVRFARHVLESRVPRRRSFTLCRPRLPLHSGTHASGGLCTAETLSNRESRVLVLGELRPVDVRLPHPAVRVRREQRPDLVKERQPLIIGEICDPAHGSEEGHDSVPVESLRIRQARVPDRFESSRGQRTAPVPANTLESAKIQRIAADVGGGQTAEQQPLDRHDRRVPRTRRNVPHENDAPTWPENSRDLRQRLVVEEPMKGLSSEHRVDRSICKREILSRPAEHICSRAPCHQLPPHSLRGFDGKDVRTSSHQQARELAGARTEVKGGRGRQEASKLDGLARPTWPSAFVVRGPAVKTSGGHAPGACHRTHRTDRRPAWPGIASSWRPRRDPTPAGITRHGTARTTGRTLLTWRCPMWHGRNMRMRDAFTCWRPSGPARWRPRNRPHGHHIA